MKKIIAKTQPNPSQVIFEINGFAVEVCRSSESLEIALRLRYKAYLDAGHIQPNEEEMLYDGYDFMAHTRTHLVWFEGKPIGTVRSNIYSEQYGWKPTESVKFFPKGMQKLGEETRILESNRFAIDPEFQGRQSLFARILMFRIHALSSAFHGCTEIVTAVKKKHIPFYQRFLGMKSVSDEVKKVNWAVEAEIVLLSVDRETSFELALQRGLPPVTEEDVERYATCAGLLYKKNFFKAA